MKKAPPEAVVLGLFETGLGLIRSLGRAGVRVFGLDTAPLCASRSRYCSPLVCPDPITHHDEFVGYLHYLADGAATKPVLFLTSDLFLAPVAAASKSLSRAYLFNIPSAELLHKIMDKYLFHDLIKSCGIPGPKTALFDPAIELKDNVSGLAFPLIIKARDVIPWRKAAGPSKKAFLARNFEELQQLMCDPVLQRLPLLIQEVIPGPDTNHWKFCGYVSKDGTLKRFFTLQKIRQQPVGHGVGSCVESRYNEEVFELGRKLFSGIGYRGVGSAEFKRDETSNEFKIVELNARYWQQNALAASSGVDFALTEYYDLTGRGGLPVAPERFREGVRWVNIHRDWEAYGTYHARGELTFGAWLKTLRPPLVFSDFSWDDPLPILTELNFKSRWHKAFSTRKKRAYPDLPASPPASVLLDTFDRKHL